MILAISLDAVAAVWSVAAPTLADAVTASPASAAWSVVVPVVDNVAAGIVVLAQQEMLLA